MSAPPGLTKLLRMGNAFRLAVVQRGLGNSLVDVEQESVVHLLQYAGMRGLHVVRQMHTAYTTASIIHNS